MLTPRTFTMKKHLALKTYSNTGDHPKNTPRGNSPQTIFLPACFIKKENLVAKRGRKKKEEKKENAQNDPPNTNKRKTSTQNTTRTIKRFGTMNGKGKREKERNEISETYSSPPGYKIVGEEPHALIENDWGKQVQKD